MLLHDLEELTRVERGGPLDPRIERVRRDRVELLLRRHQEVPRVVDLDVHLRVVDDVEIVIAEVFRDDLRDQRLDLGDRLVLDGRVDRDGTRRHAGAAPDDQHLRGTVRNQRRHVAEHPLQPHVLRLARRLHLAGVVIVEHAAREARDRDRGVPSFAHIDDVGLTEPCRRVAAVRHEDARHRMDTARQQAGGGSRRDDADRSRELKPLARRFRRERPWTGRAIRKAPT